VIGGIRFVICLCLTAVAPAVASTWEKFAKDELICLSFASPQEHAQIDAPLLPRPVTPTSLAGYFGRQPSLRSRHADAQRNGAGFVAEFVGVRRRNRTDTEFPQPDFECETCR
jgi:hypothetical protein